MAKLISKQLLHVRHHPGVGLTGHKLSITWRCTYDDEYELIYTAVGLGQDLEVELHSNSEFLVVDEEHFDLADLSVHPLSFDLLLTTLYASRFIEVIRD